MNNKLLAQEPITNKALKPVLQGLTGSEFLNDLLPNLIGLGFVIGIILFIFMLIIGAIQWIFSGGDKAAMEGARSKLTNALIGLIILFAVYVIIQIVENLFAINIINIDIGQLYI